MHSHCLTTKEVHHLVNIMGDAVINLAKKNGFHAHMTKQFLEQELPELKQCLISIPDCLIGSDNIIHILDNVEKRVNNPELFCNNVTKTTSVLGEVLLGSMIAVVKLIEDLAIWLEDFMPHVVKLGIKFDDLKKIENEHMRAIDYNVHIQQKNLNDRVCQLLSCINQKDLPFFETVLKQTNPDRQISRDGLPRGEFYRHSPSEHGFYRHFSQQQHKRVLKQPVEKCVSKDDISVLLNAHSSIFATPQKNKKRCLSAQSVSEYSTSASKAKITFRIG